MKQALLPMLLGTLLLTTILPMASAAQSGQTETIKVSLLPFFSSAPVFIAKEKGFFSDERLHVELVYTGAAQNVALSVASNQADIGVTALTAGFYNLAGRGELKIIAGQYQEKAGWTGSTFVACNKAYQEGLNSPDKTIHHRMGITQTGSTFHRWYGIVAQQQRLSLDNARLVRLHSVPAMIAAVSTCQVQSIILPPHVAAKLEKDNKAQRIGRVSDYHSGQMGIVFSSSESLKKRPDSIRKFLRAYQKASQIYFDVLIAGKDHQATQALFHQVNQHLSPKVPEDLLPDAVVYLDRMARPDIPSMEENLQWYQQQKLVKDTIQLEPMLRLDLLNSLTSDK